MLYETKEAWESAPQKRVMLFGMSGLGKTYISTLLRRDAGWFHYSVDYRIGTRYMGEHIEDAFKTEAMHVPYLANLLKSDSIHISSNITFENLAPLSTYLGKPGDPSKGGLAFDEYLRRQAQHRDAEIHAMQDTAHFIDRAKRLYGYDHFVCDTSGSMCEVVDPLDPNDPVLSALRNTVLLVWIEGSDAHTEALVRRFDKAPKPMYYQPEFLQTAWKDYTDTYAQSEQDVDPDAFVRWAYSRALAHRQPIYRAIAQHWGVTVPAEEVACVQSPDDLDRVIGAALERAV